MEGIWRNHRHRSCPFWAAPADNPITLLAAACSKCFASRLSLTTLKRSDAANGFEALPRRWVVERTFAGSGAAAGWQELDMAEIIPVRLSDNEVWGATGFPSCRP